MNEYFSLKFATSSGKLKSLRINGANTDLVSGALSSLFNKIVNSGALDTSESALTGFLKGDMVKETREVLI